MCPLSSCQFEQLMKIRQCHLKFTEIMKKKNPSLLHRPTCIQYILCALRFKLCTFTRINSAEELFTKFSWELIF